MSDLINRYAIIEKMRNRRRLFCKNHIEYSILSKDEKTRVDEIDNCIACLLNSPKAEPKPKWIPVAEGLPEEKDAGILKKLGTSKRSDYVLATVEVKDERMTVTACTYDGAWHWNMKYAFPDYEVIAWMPLPESYKGD